jgi:monoamine oxidase
MTDGVLDRRRFLRAAAAGAAGVLGGPELLAGASRGETTQADVLIIGSGMAGVAAGSALRSYGISAIVLEGRPDRIGGRIWTSFKWPDVPVDMGASWLTHETINPLAKLAAESGIATTPSELLDFTLSEADGTVLPDAEIERILLIYTKLYANVKLLAEQRIARRLPDLPASDAFARLIARQRLSPTTLRRLNFFLNLTIKEPNAAPLRDLSLKYWDDDYVFATLYTSVFPRGYVQLVNLLAAGLDIRLGHVVTEIAHGPLGVTVSTKQGQFSAPHAIVTLPHGVLSSGAVEFSPPLPPWKRSAIQRLRTGVSNKTYLRFPTRFWDPEPNTLGRVAETSESRWSTWINYYKLTGVPMLMAFNHGDYARQLEAMSDTEVMDVAMQVLRKQYGRSIPEPLGIQQSRWGSDPFTHGTVAHVPPGASGADFALMGMPVGPLGFAGDSTTADFPTLAFGAYLTGVKEAQRIALLLGLGSPEPGLAPRSTPAPGGQPSGGVAVGKSPSSGTGISRPGAGSGHHSDGSKGSGGSNAGNHPLSTSSGNGQTTGGTRSGGHSSSGGGSAHPAGQSSSSSSGRGAHLPGGHPAHSPSGGEGPKPHGGHHGGEKP